MWLLTLIGLGAPYWQSEARALFSGITFNTTRAELARAVTDTIAIQVFDVIAAMSAQSPAPLGALYVDGGPSQSRLLMGCVADVLGHAPSQRDAPEASALGAATSRGSRSASGQASTASPRCLAPAAP